MNVRVDSKDVELKRKETEVLLVLMVMVKRLLTQISLDYTFIFSY